MSKATRRWLTWGLAGVVLGAALGLLIGWWLWPLRYADASPAYLRTDYRDEYIVMTAEAYQIDGDLEAARTRLRLIDAQDQTKPLIELAQRLIDADGDAADVARLTSLASALDPPSPTVTAYLESS